MAEKRTFFGSIFFQRSNISTAIKLEEGAGAGQALMARPLREEFFAASLRETTKSPLFNALKCGRWGVRKTFSYFCSFVSYNSCQRIRIFQPENCGGGDFVKTSFQAISDLKNKTNNPTAIKLEGGWGKALMTLLIRK